VSTYFGASYRRLQQVKRRYDPDDFFHYAQRNPG
jgi:hypothetical protein